MNDKEIIKELLNVIECAIKNKDWKVDGACDPDLIILIAKRHLQNKINY